MSPILLSRKEVEKMVGLSYPTFHKLEKENKFPKRKQITQARVGWLYSELLEWATSLSNSASQS